MRKRLPGLLVLQATPFCNLDCNYCYLSKASRSDRSTMSLETVRRAAELVRDSHLHDELTVLWHCGEPLVVPLEWYRAAQRILAEVLGEGRLRFQYQTNATLMTPSWVEFLSRTSDTHVSISIDGPAEFHDARRRTRRGGPTHARVMEGIARLKHAGVPFSAIAVVTSGSVSDPDRFYDFFVELGPVGLAINPEEQDGAHATSSLEGEEEEGRFRRFFRRFVERWRVDRPFWVRELTRIDQLLQRLSRGEPPPSAAENQLTRAGSTLSVDWQGNLHTFSPELLGTELPGLGTHLGNVHRDRWADLQASPQLQTLQAEIGRGVERCRTTCPYFDLCLGGAPSNKWFEHGSFDSGETRHCRLAFQAPFDALSET